MKIRNMVILFTVIMMAGYLAAITTINASQINRVDVTEINQVAKTIEQDWQAGDTKKSGANRGLPYQIALVTDENYQALLYDGIKNRQTIIDLTGTAADGQEKLLGKIIILTDGSEEATMKRNLTVMITLTFGLVLIMVYLLFGLVHTSILRPFGVLKEFARKIADGDLEFRLPMDRGNYFGAFTESFDLMREELRKARQGEYQANISKKELVAELSHDIKTPVATIKAICELLEIKLATVQAEDLPGSTAATTITESIAKIAVIDAKADIIDALISNLFHATLEELEMLKVNVSEQPSTVIIQMFKEMDNFGKIRFKNDLAECLVFCDPLRLGQVIDNIISNSYKYADTDIDIWFGLDKTDKNLTIKIKDYGAGVDPDECPLVCEKFFRGSGESIQNTPGSGLGLYLARQFMVAMGGSIRCYNEGGFTVELGIKVV
ncbi:HAMP domain-containing sensor histidine kinase [Acetobacterium sp.]|uniref:HAMP domain-containing sensor histidine kinase n=1 Tax=Acetobacterium sp. TaxID=1872094 RepID=UPI002724DCB7|nr:HAMP domain-containing sensor histidine kinase [Acetobacterium sp.]MDO9492755.1 HAMP domain-containing sensor histidine kinase [Acetobacterium sp.]